MQIIRTNSIKIEFQHDTTVKQLLDALKDVPYGAKLRVEHWPGSQRDPEYTAIIFTW